MPNLHQTLRQNDLDFLQRIARQWGIELLARDFQAALDELESGLCDADLFAEILEALPTDVKAAWQYLAEHEGREAWALYTRKFGELRAMGVARRERVAPDDTPASAIESLWYKGLIGRAFLSLSGEAKEYAYIPDEFMALINPSSPTPSNLLPRPATENETCIQLKANDRLLDDATDLLAALRMNREATAGKTAYQLSYTRFMQALLTSAAILSGDGQPNPQRLKDFLSASRSQALFSLFQNWQTSSQLNDLRMLPGLVFEGNWTNDPLLPRKLLTEILGQLSGNTWWSITSLLAQIKENQPDFQRPVGDYDSWFIRDAKTNVHLQGTRNWDKIEGALIRYLVSGPLHWLGVLDLGFAEKNSRPSSFKISPYGTALLAQKEPAVASDKEGGITIVNDSLIVPLNTPLTLRYQIARFGQPIRQAAGETRYQITPASLQAAAAQGLMGNHLIQLLQQAKIKNIPPVLIQQIERWEKYGSEVIFEQPTLLRFTRPEILPLLQKNPRSARCIEEVLNSKTVIVTPGGIETLRQILAELGFLV